MKVLIADDDPISRHLLTRTLTKWGYEVVACSDGREAWQMLLEEGIKLAILDWEMPDMNGIDVCQLVRSTPSINTYLILLSARDTQTDVIAGLESGADDFVRKPFDSAELRARLKTGKRIIDLEQSLKEQTIRDPLTGLYNRRCMEETLERELARAERKRGSLGLILLDIDHFKKVNDTHGHQAGDAVLQAVGNFLQVQIRLGDVACRFGGEEFVLILPDATVDVTATRAEQLRKAISQLEVQYNGEMMDPVHLSAGIAVYPQHGTSHDVLLHNADNALYQAKALGRNRVLIATATTFFEMNAAVS